MDAIRRPFRFGVAANGLTTRHEWLELARKVEALGYSSLLVGDHFYWLVSPFAALMAAADVAPTIRVGGYVFNNDLRHPAVLAKEVATLDVMTDGRVELGLGAGWYAPEYAEAGLRFDDARVRIDRLDESIQVLKQLFGPDPATFTGQHYSVTGLEGVPKPVQQPHPPILIGGSGRRLLSLAAREADIIGLVPRMRNSRLTFADASLEVIHQRLAWVRQEAGARFHRIEIGTLLFDFQITDDRHGQAERAIAAFADEPQAAPFTAQDYLESVSVLVGTLDQIVEQLQLWREQLGISYIVVSPQEHVDAFAPIVARLAGT